MASKKSDDGPVEKSPHAHDLQKAVDEATEKGFWGDKVDPTPNENYSLQTPPDAPTPETHEDAAREAYGRTDAVAARFPKGGDK